MREIVFQTKMFKNKTNLLRNALQNLKDNHQFDLMEIYWDPDASKNPYPLTYFQSLHLLHNIESDLQSAWELLADFDVNALPFFLKSSKILALENRKDSIFFIIFHSK